MLSMQAVRTLQYQILLISVLTLSSLAARAGDSIPHFRRSVPLLLVNNADTLPPVQPRYGDFLRPNGYRNPFDLKDPSIIERSVEYDPVTDRYLVSEKIGEDYYLMPTYMTSQEYMDYKSKEQEKAYFRQLAGLGNGQDLSGDPIGKIDVKKSLADRLFGGTGVEIRPQGNIDLTFGGDYQNVKNPNLTFRQQRNGGFNFDMAIQMNVTGKIGEKLNLNTSYNTQATFDFDNQMKLSYNTAGFSEDEIIKNIEAGNVSLPLKSTLITGAQSLFGVKTELQFGRLRVTGIASQQKSRQTQLQLQGGAQVVPFEVRADEYDENRNFFLSYYNRDNFETALKNLPQINSLFRITKLEVFVTNDRYETQNVRDIVAIADLGEPKILTNVNPSRWIPAVPRHLDINQQPLPGRDQKNMVEANDIYPLLKANPNVRKLNEAVAVLTTPPFSMQQARDFEKVSARILNPSEYTFIPELGVISLNINLQPDQVLGVSYEYDYNGKVYQVGEFSNDSYSSNDTLGVLFVKLLKGTTPRIDLPIWDLMMKNVYNIGAYNVDQKDFLLDIFYEDPGGGQKRFLPTTNLAGEPLLRVFGMDKLNVTGDPAPDGRFDYVPGITIFPRNGRIMFPVLEPFGEAIAKQISDPIQARQFDYFMLYDSTVFRAREYPEFNRFTIKGTYKSAIQSEISLGTFNLPRGSVRVRAGGQELRENIDYEVDYGIGRLKIINDALLQAAQPITVSFEDNSLFSFQTKTMLGLRADFAANKQLNIGGTFMHLFERPFTPKVNIGEDPINNRVFGLDVNYSGKAPWLTKLVDAIPGISTKEESQISFTAETAWLKPGHSKAINLSNLEEGTTDKAKRDRGGAVYLDDFEGSTSGFDLRIPANAWVMASVPQNDAANNNPLFPESALINDIRQGANRAKLAWYRMEPNYQVQGDPYSMVFDQREVFPNVTIQAGQPSILQTLDLSFEPEARGPYNYDTPAGYQGFSKGVSTNGALVDPQSRWAGISRGIQNNNFEAANIEYLEFWMLNPFINGDNPGDFYINLGNVSEDVLRDSRMFFENGVATDPNGKMDNTAWGRVPRTQVIVNAFENNPQTKDQQDVGFDGLNDDGERNYFVDFINTYKNTANYQTVAQTLEEDPSSDNYQGFRSANTNTAARVRYRHFNSPQGNSPTPDNNQQFTDASNFLPDSEDLNRDNSLNETESYYQYKIPLKGKYNNDMGVYELDVDQTPYITDIIRTDPADKRTWYRFKVPLDQYSSAVGGIQGFRSIRFMRMFLTNFKLPVVLRFAQLQLTRNQWRRYLRNVSVALEPGVIPDDDSGTIFDVNAVNIEQNSGQLPFGYVLPPGLFREQSLNTTFANNLQNEQSLSMEFCNLKPGRGKAIYKTLNLDMRLFENLRMFVHGELKGIPKTDRGKLAVFIRLGSDFENNFYEYEIPLELSDNTNISYNDPAYALEVWKPSNNFDIPLGLLKDIKLRRNDNNWPLNVMYEETDPTSTDHKVRVKGNPNLGYVRGVMVGIVNRDEIAHCGEVWINEMRVNGLNEKGGVAAISRLDMKLADFGNMTMAGSFSSIGWGALDQRLAQRSRERTIQYDIAGNLELGKFLPKDWGIKLPFYAQYSNSIKLPEYDPYDLDVKLDEKLDRAKTSDIRDSLRTQAITQTEIKSYNFTNVRKERTNNRAGSTPKAQMPWNIENFSVTYAYSETNRRDPIIESDQMKVYNGGLNYQYSRQAKFVEPLSKIIKNDKWNKYLGFFTDFNFNPVPNNLTFNTSLNRVFQTTSYRFAGTDPAKNTFFNKQFVWNRNYSMNWDLSKGLKFNFNAVNNGVIDEPEEIRNGELISSQFRKDSIWQNIRNLGRTKNYNHNFNVNWQLPINKIPFLSWVQVKAQYSGNYTWSAAALNTQNLGNVIQNGQVRQVNTDFNFESIYRGSKYLSKIDRKPGTSTSTNNRNNSTGPNRRGTAPGGPAPAPPGDLKNVDPRKAKDPRVATQPQQAGSTGGGDPAEATDADGKPKKGKKAKGGADDEDKDKEREPSVAERIALRPLLLLRKARFNYQENLGTIVPGFTQTTRFLGQSQGFVAPGWDFVGGLQPDIANRDFSDPANYDWLQRAAQRGWISDDILMNQQVLQNYSQVIDARLTLEPLPDFIIDIDANRNYTKNKSLYFRDTTQMDAQDIIARRNEIVHTLPREMGSYTISFIGLNTLFDDSQDEITALFRRFESNRQVISGRLGVGVHDKDLNYTQGYGKTQQDVLIPSFLAAYTNADPSKVKVDKNYSTILFRTLPRPNWRFTYNGLSKLKWFKDIFTSVSISHGYKSTLTVNSFVTDQQFNEENVTGKNLNGNYYSRLEIPAIVINEQFSPLFGLDMKMKNGMSFRADMKKSRNLAMSFLDYRLAETRTTDYTIGFGHRIKNVVIPFLQFGKAKTEAKKNSKKKSKIKVDPNASGNNAGGTSAPQGSDLNIKFDVSFRDDITLNHLLDQGIDAQPTRGLRTLRISPSVDYQITKNLNARLFFDYNRSNPKTSQAFPITNMNGGVTVRFSL